MRVGLVIYGSLDWVSGGYLYDRCLVNRLRADGHEVEVVALPGRTYARHLMDNWSQHLRRHLADASYDLLLQDELNHPSLFRLNYRLRRRVSYPILAIVHHLRLSEVQSIWQRAPYRWIEQRYLASVDGYIANSATTCRTITALIGEQRPHVVARPGSDRLGPALPRPTVEARLARPRPLQVVFLGNVIARKGLHVLLAALSRLPRGSWRLTVIGSLDHEPGYVRRLRQFALAQSLGDSIIFTGRLSDHELRQHLTDGDVLVMPSAYEGYGIAYAEAMGFGLPSIASTGGAAHEIVTHGQTGYLIDPGDVQQLTNYLHLLSADRSLLRTLSLAALDRYATQPTWAETTSAILDFLNTQHGLTARHEAPAASTLVLGS